MCARVLEIGKQNNRISSYTRSHVVSVFQSENVNVILHTRIQITQTRTTDMAILVIFKVVFVVCGHVECQTGPFGAILDRLPPSLVIFE